MLVVWVQGCDIRQREVTKLKGGEAQPLRLRSQPPPPPVGGSPPSVLPSCPEGRTESLAWLIRQTLRPYPFPGFAFGEKAVAGSDEGIPWILLHRQSPPRVSGKELVVSLLEVCDCVAGRRVP